MATRYSVIAGTALVAGAVGSSVYQAATQSDARNAMGAGTSTVAVAGDGVMVVRTGDAGTLDAAGAADGAVVAVVNGAPTLTTVSAGSSLPDAAGVADGAVLTQAGGAQTWTSPGGLTVTTFRASDCVAESGASGDEVASITGSGAGSTFTLTAGATARTYSSSGTTAARVLCAIPAGAVRIDAEVGVTAASGFATSGNRYLAAVLRPTGGGTPTVAWGVSWNDNNTLYWGNLSSAANAGSGSSLALSIAANRWMRAVWDTSQPQLGFTFGTGSGGARPTAWLPPNGAATMPTGTTAFIVDTSGTASAVAVYLQSFGTGGATSVTASLTIRVLSL